jgi:putative intracellular protease/amidase
MEARYNYVGGDVVSDRNLITAVGAGLSIDFGLELLAALTNEATVEKVKKGMEI